MEKSPCRTPGVIESDCYFSAAFFSFLETFFLLGTLSFHLPLLLQKLSRFFRVTGPAKVTWPELGQSESFQGSLALRKRNSVSPGSKDWGHVNSGATGNHSLVNRTCHLAVKSKSQKKTQREVGGKSQREGNAWCLHGSWTLDSSLSLAGISVLQFYKILQLSLQTLSPPRFFPSLEASQNQFLLFSRKRELASDI